MKIKYYCVFLLFICDISVAHSINPTDCDEMQQQDETYWCIMDKYQQSVLELKQEEARAQKTLEKYDNQSAGEPNENDGSIEYEPYIHLARMTFPELHRSFILFREQQCKFSVLKFGPLPGYHSSIESLYCKTWMNISQIKWIKDSI